jgi:hypothetical protein
VLLWGFAMKSHIFSACLVALVIGGVALFSPAMETRVETSPIDFVSLHNQASAAIQSLQLLQERRMAALQTSEAKF